MDIKCLTCVPKEMNLMNRTNSSTALYQMTAFLNTFLFYLCVHSHASLKQNKKTGAKIKSENPQKNKTKNCLFTSDKFIDYFDLFELMVSRHMTHYNTYVH